MGKYDLAHLAPADDVGNGFSAWRLVYTEPEDMGIVKGIPDSLMEAVEAMADQDNGGKGDSTTQADAVFQLAAMVGGVPIMPAHYGYRGYYGHDRGPAAFRRPWLMFNRDVSRYNFKFNGLRFIQITIHQDKNTLPTDGTHSYMLLDVPSPSEHIRDAGFRTGTGLIPTPPISHVHVVWFDQVHCDKVSRALATKGTRSSNDKLMAKDGDFGRRDENLLYHYDQWFKSAVCQYLQEKFMDKPMKALAKYATDWVQVGNNKYPPFSTLDDSMLVRYSHRRSIDFSLVTHKRYRGSPVDKWLVSGLIEPMAAQAKWCKNVKLPLKKLLQYGNVKATVNETRLDLIELCFPAWVKYAGAIENADERKDGLEGLEHFGRMIKMIRGVVGKTKQEETEI